MDELHKQLHDIRKEIDATMQKVEGLKTNPVALTAGRNLALCFTHLEDAKMRLGKALGDVGSELPAHFADKAEQPVQPTAPEQPAGNGTPPPPPAQPSTPNAQSSIDQAAAGIQNLAQQQPAQPEQSAATPAQDNNNNQPQ